MNEIWTTVCGNIVTDPTHRLTDDGLPIVKFRVASTPSVFKQGQGFVDGATSYLTVTCFRRLAENAGGSLSKGEPIIAFGRLRVREYQNKEGRTAYDTEIEAVAVGHDLSRGTAMFRRVSRAVAAAPEPVAAPAAAYQGDADGFEGDPGGFEGEADGFETAASEAADAA